MLPLHVINGSDSVQRFYGRILSRVKYWYQGLKKSSVQNLEHVDIYMSIIANVDFGP